MYIEDKSGGKQILLLSTSGKGKLQPCPALGIVLKPSIWVPPGIHHQFHRYRLLSMTQIGIRRHPIAT
jgi:hypothetical protein